MWKTCSSSFLKVSSFKLKMCATEFFDSLKVWGVWKKALWIVESVKFQVYQKEFFALLQVSSEISSCVIKDLQVIEVFLFKFTWGVKDFLSKLSIFWESVCCSICVQNVFFSNGVLESHGEVWWWQLSPLEVQNAHDAFQTWTMEKLLMGVPSCQVKKL